MSDRLNETVAKDRLPIVAPAPRFQYRSEIELMTEIRRLRAVETAAYLKRLGQRARARLPVAREVAPFAREIETVIAGARAARGAHLAKLLADAVAPLARLITRLRRSLAQARDMRELASLDDRMLADIGVRRSEIPGVVLEGRGGRDAEAVKAHPLTTGPAKRLAA